MITAGDIVQHFAPQAKSAYKGIFADPADLLDQYGVNTPMRLAHFMAQAFHETGALTVLEESGRYKEKGLARMWDDGNWHTYFPNREACLAMSKQCDLDKGEALFNLVYGGRMGNGLATTGDGWRFRGRGVIQTTGRESYQRAVDKWKVDFAGYPELVLVPEHGLKAALTEWSGKNLNLAADNNDIKLITKRINGGLVGLDERKAWFAKIWPFVSGSPEIEQTREWRVQEALFKLGYKKAVPDGVIGVNTRDAILEYRVARGLTNAPGITGDLLLALGIQ